MSARETRLLLLGAVALFEPVNGYQIRRELVSWQVDRWAHVRPGSIYHGLNRLSDQGLLLRHDLVDGAREVAVYEVSPDGRAELERMLVEGLETVDTYLTAGFHAAFSMMPLLPEGTARAALEVRRAALQRVIDGYPEGMDEPDIGAPPHAVRSMMLWRDTARTELDWLDETLAQIRSGRLPLGQGDDGGWRPPDDDPGWQMEADRKRYRELLRR